MITLNLGRNLYSPQQGTFGWLKLPVVNWECVTLEEIWKNNQKNISCIPCGTYKLRRAILHISTPYPDDDYACWQLVDVPDRTAINVHIVNTISDVRGCIGVGERHGVVDNHWAILNSRKTFSMFMERMDILEAQDSDLWIAIGNVSPVGGVVL